MPLVSVIIPAYNYAPFVEEAISSVRAQNYSNIEIIVVDDGSTDATPELLSDREDIIYLRQDNQGLSAARNRGIEAARGKYLQFLDADDTLGHQSIQRRVTFLEAHPQYSAVMCRAAEFRRWARRGLLIRLGAHRLPIQPRTMDLDLYFSNIGLVHSFLVRRAVVMKHALRFDTSMRACEDYDFWFRLASCSGMPALVNNCWVHYRRHRASMSRSLMNQYIHDAEMSRRLLAGAIRGAPWLGRRHPAVYLTALLAGALATGRRLWSLDPVRAKVFIDSHVRSILENLIQERRRGSADTEAIPYPDIGRSMAAAMYFRDRSIDRDLYAALILAFSKTAKGSARSPRNFHTLPSMRDTLRAFRARFGYWRWSVWSMATGRSVYVRETQKW